MGLKEIRIHGRGGQGSVVLAQFLAIAALEDGKQSQAFPFLGGGGDRRGAPIQAFARMSDKPIRLRSRIYTPDYVIVQDATIFGEVDLFAGIKPDGTMLINTEKSAEEATSKSSGEQLQNIRTITVPATRIALATIGRPIANTALAGAFSAVTGEVSLQAILEAIAKKFEGEVAEKNIRAAQEAYRLMKDEE